MKTLQAIFLAAAGVVLVALLILPRGTNASFQSMQPISGTPSGACTPPLLNADVNSARMYYCGADNVWHLGLGQVGFVSCMQATCASSATTFFTTSATTLYRINASVACTGTTAAATAIMVIKYTDPGSTVQTVTLATATCTALGSTSIANLEQGVMIATGTNVQYSVTVVNAPNYQARAAVYQEGMN